MVMLRYYSLKNSLEKPASPRTQRLKQIINLADITDNMETCFYNNSSLTDKHVEIQKYQKRDDSTGRKAGKRVSKDPFPDKISASVDKDKLDVISIRKAEP